MSKNRYDESFKILVLGEGQVGKTCMLLRYIEDSFTNNHMMTIGIDFKIKILKIGDKLIKLQIYDTAGQERFKTITKTFYKGAQGIVLAFDLSTYSTFRNMDNWIKQIQSCAQKNVSIVLVGNKCDIANRNVTQKEATNFASDNGLTYFETSAKTGHNINEVFEFLTKEIIKNKESTPNILTKSMVLTNDNNDSKNKEKKKCCKS